MNKMIPVFGSKVGKEELDEIKTSINNQWLGIGKKVDTFEQLMTEKINSNFLAIDNCSNGLYLALKILNLPKGSEILVPAITWISCANAVMVAGYKPVFVDCDYNTVNVTTDLLEEVRTPKTKAAIIVHYAGLPCIVDIDLPVIADCAHAVDTYIGNTHIAYTHTLNVFSFDSIKNLAAAELGGISSNNLEYIKQAKTLRYCGIAKSGLQASTDKDKWWEYQCYVPFIKMLPNDLSASVAIAQFKKLEQLQKRRKEVWDQYNEAFKEINWLIIPPKISKEIKHSFFTYFIKITNGKRNALARYLLNNNIYTTVRYHPLHLMEVFNSKRKLPVAEQINEELLNLPLHPNLSDEDVKYIITKIKQFGKGK